jgi:molybdopterin-guanine dinucleotide biosynthesis protein A
MSNAASLPVGVILAGGSGTRLADKAGSTVGGVPIIQRVLNALRPACGSMLLVVGQRQEWPGVGIPQVHDEFSGCGPLAGIHAALKATGQPCFVVACDMPFLDSGLIRYMVRQGGGREAVVPFVRGRYEPLHALYSPQCLTPIEESLGRGNLKVADLFPRLRVRQISEEEIRRFGEPEVLFFNVNTPEELELANQRAGR